MACGFYFFGFWPPIISPLSPKSTYSIFQDLLHSPHSQKQPRCSGLLVPCGQSQARDLFSEIQESFRLLVNKPWVQNPQAVLENLQEAEYSPLCSLWANHALGMLQLLAGQCYGELGVRVCQALEKEIESLTFARLPGCLFKPRILAVSGIALRRWRGNSHGATHRDWMKTRLHRSLYKILSANAWRPQPRASIKAHYRL